LSKIERIFVAGYKHDVVYTRPCIASIRKWFPDVRITLIKDYYYGDYSTADIEYYWDVDVLDTGNKKYGWGFSKLEALFLSEKTKFLMLDSDTVFYGPVLDRLNEYNEDFIVPAVKTGASFQTNQYYDATEIEVFDSNYKHPGLGFNTGQWVGTGGLFTMEDFSPYINSGNEPVSLKNEKLFKCGEQGLLNYFLFKKEQEKKISLCSVPFMETGNNGFVDEIENLDDIPADQKPIVIHWAGIRAAELKDSANAWILTQFNEVFYSKLSFGKLRNLLTVYRNRGLGFMKNLVKSILKG
jgi:hypothetical protein